MTDGVFVNIPDLIDICTRAKSRAEANADEELALCVKSVLSAAVLHLGTKHATLPEAIRPCYDKLLEG